MIIHNVVDIPMVISQEHVALIDPHLKCVGKRKATSPAGTKKRLTSFFKHGAHVSTFESMFSMNTKEVGRYNGTIFRFPLRQQGSNSEISRTVYTPQMIQSLLFESFKEESPYILLFLQNVRSISLMEWKENASTAHETFKVELSQSAGANAQATPGPLSGESSKRQHIQSVRRGGLDSYIEIKATSVNITEYNGSTTVPTTHHWLVINSHGTSDSELAALGKKQLVLPWIGLATKLPVPISLDACRIEASMPHNDKDGVLNSLFMKLELPLHQAQQSVTWSSEAIAHCSGHAFCFLPLPESTAMPIHVHGYFAVADNRRSIKWPGHDEKGKEAQWNRELLRKMVAPSYALLLACRASLIHYEQTPLPVTNTDSVSDAYSAWPRYAEIKNIRIWNELLSPTLELCTSLPLLWTPACGGKWVHFSDACFLPGTFSSSYDYSDTVIQLLISLDIPVVSLPKSICETIAQREKLIEIVQEISPQFVRTIVKGNPQCCASLTKKDVYNLLAYILQDLNEGIQYFALNYVPLLPLKGISQTVMFETPKDDNRKYIFTPKLQPLIDVVPGANSSIVDPEIPSTVAKKLCHIASTGYFQLVETNMQVMCKHLLPVSIQLWCGEKEGIGWKWIPGKGSMPPQSWMTALWKWIREYSVSLSDLQELPIVPLMPFSKSQHEVTLVQPQGDKMFCCLSVPYGPRNKATLINILRKFTFLIVDKSRMNNCDTWMSEHSDLKTFIPELLSGLELVLQHLNQLDLAARLRKVEKLDSCERDFLRRQFSALYDSCTKYRECLRSLPIYHAAGTHQPHFVAIDKAGSSHQAFLPPENIPTLPEYPPEMLQSVLLPEEKEMFKIMQVKQLSMSELCVDFLIPQALKHIQSQPNSWSIGDDLVLWILKLQKLSKTTINSLSEHDIICSRSSVHKKPRDMYDPQDRDKECNILTLFNSEVDGEHFPHEHYFTESRCRRALLEMGMKSWKSIKKDDTLLNAFLQDRMKSISNLGHSAQLQRGALILKLLAKPENHNVLSTLVNIPFLFAESFPSHYPSVLKEIWHGQKDKLYSIQELCLQSDYTLDLVGTVKPILSHYYCSSRQIEFIGALKKLHFQAIAEDDVLKHLENLESVNIGNEGVDKFDHIVVSVYEHLYSNSCSRKLKLIWWRQAERSGFLPANRFVLKLPDSLRDHLEPFYYFLRGSLRKYARLFEIHDTLTTMDVASVIKSTKESSIDLGKKLTKKQIEHCLSVLYWLYEEQYKESSMLILTEHCTLLPAIQCVFDDRSWLKGSQSEIHVETSSLCFVHDRISPKVAKHFQVTPLSLKVFPSQNIGISYITVGQHEEITHRIKKIVDDYENDIDVFKELIQNADDAGATEIKFLIDWRHHPTESLIAEELKEWQGPALIVYNNATFSDEDFDNICKVAGETKKEDPFKIGRFGVGFCATYHLTDLPSFISRRYFTVFDSHTTYLGRRVSANAPGMRVDLIENKGSLQVYRDQFIPYEGLFNCNIFSLEAEGEYPGTLFRFPFRSSLTSQKSKICKKIYDKDSVSVLVQALKEQSHKLLLFLKHIKQVSLHELKEGSIPSTAKEVFSVRSTVESSIGRTELIRKCNGNSSESCLTKIDIQVCNGAKEVQGTWLVSSAIENCLSDLQCRPEAKGLLPLAEVAIEIDQSTNERMWMPITSSKYGKVFCFLPLPITIPLPFHVNGFFSVGKDRRNISATDDESFGSLWNQALAEGPLVPAFIHLLSNLCSNCNLSAVTNPEIKEKYLCSYYALWKFSGASSLIGDKFITAFKDCIPKEECPVIWSEINGGCWLPPTCIVVFRDDMLRNKSEQVIVKYASDLLLHSGLNLANLPDHVYEILKESLTNSGRVYDLEKVFTKYLFPDFAKIDPEVQDINIKFLLERHGKESCFPWAENFLRTHPCIPCEGSETLRPTCQLIDPSNKLLKNLYDVSEGRFPSKGLQGSPMAMQCLRVLGMTSRKLSVEDLEDRAKLVEALNTEGHEFAYRCSQHICAYIGSVYHASDNLTELQSLFNISFLPVKGKPPDVDVPWCGKSPFASPLELFSSQYECLIFSQHPVLEDMSDKSAYARLEITTKRPSYEIVMAHLKCVIENIHGELSDATAKYLDKSMKELYSYIQVHHSSPEEVTQLLQMDKFIWQDGHFLSPTQVVGFWNNSCVPYLCQLSTANQQFLDFFEVKREATVEMLVQVLGKIAKDHDTKPLSDKILEFVEFTSGQLEKNLPNEEYISSVVIFLPDEEKIMRETSVLADNVSLEWIKTSELYQRFVRNKNCLLVHKTIPQERAIKLGVNRLSHLMFPSHSVRLAYTKVGQHEEITHRLKRLVDEYENDIDVFKELIQNADDAGATEVKFLIDWRYHPTESLIAEELREWQGPALIVYNNATFSDEDFDSICQVAGETKRSDPFKIGRFGVGFCATYHLTDLPSFISRKYFTVFDSHTTYLGDRVSANAPGMRVDLIENKDSLQLYHDQLYPYEGLFDCNIFDLSVEDGYPATLFRFPFRNSLTGPRSKICNEVYNKQKVSKLIKSLKDQSQELLIFLKNVNRVLLYELDEGCSPSTAREVFSVECYSTVESSVQRTDLIKKCNKQFRLPWDNKTCLTRLDIRVHDANKNVQNTWLVSSAIGTCPSSLQQRPEVKGLVPLAEVAIKLDPSSPEQMWRPSSDSKYGKVFCFLPLPMTIPLPFHVNGFFSVGKDRRNISATDDESFGSQWNQALAEGPLVTAFIHLLNSLCNKCNLAEITDLEIKQNHLRSYYALWNFGTGTDLICAKFIPSFKDSVSTETSKIVWSEVKGGGWLPPTKIIVFKDDMMRHKLKKVLEKDAYDLLLQDGKNVADLPEHVYEILKTALTSSGREYNYEKFCIKHLFPSIAKIDPEVRNRNIKFLLEQSEKKFGKDDSFKWAEKFLSTSSCIPCEGSERLSKTSLLIDPRNKILESLFDVSEGRFPIKDLLNSKKAVQCLERMGMTTSKLSIGDLIDRAKSVTKVCEYELALERSQFVCTYIAAVYSGSWYSPSLTSDNRKELQPLLVIPFLPAKKKPVDVDVPWYSKFQPFDSPSHLYPHEYEHLVFSQHPVVAEGTDSKACTCLGITSKKQPTFESIITHLKCVITEIIPKESTLTLTTCQYLDKSVRALYKYIQTTHSSPQNMQQLLCLKSFIWQEGHFLSPNQVVVHWDHVHNCVPYLCQLAAANKPFAKLFEVEDEATLQKLAEILDKIAKDHDSIPISETILEFVEFTSEQLEKKIQHTSTQSLQIYLPDSNKIMRKSCVLTDNVSTEWMKCSQLFHDLVRRRNRYLIHESIPQERAIKLGVNRLSHVIFPTLSVSLTYNNVSQHKEINQKLKKTVDEYDNDTFIFKELIQNADDAGATEVKFLVDWRQHPAESLIAEELKEWQGPALIVYNNATFSDEDFDNIYKIAGETKKEDPLKIGRFGLGFYTTYHLTDLPSFVSRKYFTMFDSHTIYLGDRVTAEAPIMRVDLIENKDGVQLYHDQFIPYEGLFDCNIFDLNTADGYLGTLFRFPFRTFLASQKSKISKRMYNRTRVAGFVQALKDQSEELLLFLKHVNRVSLYELDEGCSPSAAKEVFSVECTVGGFRERNELIKNCSSRLKRALSDKTCPSKFDIRVCDGTNYVKHTWVVSSAIGAYPSDLPSSSEAKGLLPLAEVAIKVDSSMNEQVQKPVTGSVYGKIFCFLPLPMTIPLPFHVNGFFSIGNDRKSILAKNDKSFGSLWNQSLAEGALVEAVIHLLTNLCSKCKLSIIANPEIKQDCLHSYYALWNFDSVSGLIGDRFSTAFRDFVPKQKCPMIWSEINGGCWLPPTKIVVFRDDLLRRESKSAIEKDAFELLLQHGLNIADLPEHVYDILRDSLINSKRKYDYQRVCKEYVFPDISKMDPEVRDRNIIFVVEQHGKESCFDWAETCLRTTPCIPCEGSENLRPICQLIDPSNKLLENLYDVSEGRFPCKILQNSSKAMLCLTNWGMSTSKLGIRDLEDRAKSVANLEYELAVKRSQNICDYIASVYRGSLLSVVVETLLETTLSPDEVRPLLAIQFLPVKGKPNNVELPWCGKFQSFESPSCLYPPKCECLIFSQHPIVAETVNMEACKRLGITSKQPMFKSIIAHLKCIIEHIGHSETKLNNDTIQFLDASMPVLYEYIKNAHSSLQEVEQVLELKTFIWQDGHFLSPRQVVGSWGHNCFPYLCQLSINNAPFLKLFRVEKDATQDMLIETLQKIAQDYDTVPISDTLLEFVVFTAIQLERKIEMDKVRQSTIYLPDDNKIMRKTSSLADNISSDWVKNSKLYINFLSSSTGFLVHESIPRDCAIKLGVNPLLEALLREMEDHDFLKQTEFGQSEQTVCDQLSGILEDYPADITIIKEFIQNADVAQATEIAFVLDHREDFPDNTLVHPSLAWKSLQNTPALCILVNNKFTAAEIDGLAKLSGKDKPADLFGRLGIGFNVVYHITDCPSLVVYAQGGAPECLCVFDPTQSFVSHSTMWTPGRKWNFKSEDQYSEFPDQFRSYLNEDLHRLTQSVPNCLVDFRRNGYIVFRLPLTRFRAVVHEIGPSVSTHKIKSGHAFKPSSMSDLLKEFAKVSQDILLFLNHMKTVSAFEIRKDGSLVHHFTSQASIPASYQQDYESFPTCLKAATKRVSLTHQVDIAHTQPGCSHVTQWIVQRAIDKKELKPKMLKDISHQDILPIGGVAAPLKSLPNHTYNLFCNLPLPIIVSLPVHINGHFVINNFEEHCSVCDNWNRSLLQKVIIPAYIELIVTISKSGLVDTADTKKWFYSLFPQPDSPVLAKKRDKMKIGNDALLSIPHWFYKELLDHNLSVLILEDASPSLTCHWMNVKSCYFRVPYICEKTKEILSVSDELCHTLVSLGLRVTIAPDSIYHGCSQVDRSFGPLAKVEPEKVVKHIQKLKLTTENSEVIKSHIECLLQYCVSGYSTQEVPSLFSKALYLLAKNNTLQRGCLFRSQFSDLLPLKADRFVDPKLEKSKIGERLRLCQVICTLPMKYVSDNMDLPESKNTVYSFSTVNLDAIKLLWEYHSQASLLPTPERFSLQLAQYFSTKAIIPTENDTLYPVCLSKALVRSSSSKCNNCKVMKKLGYVEISFKKFPVSNKSQLNIIINNLISCFTDGEDIVKCFRMSNPQNCNVQLSDTEAISFASSLGAAPSGQLQKVANFVLEMPLFYAADGSRVSLHGVTKAYILNSTGVPLDGIPLRDREQVVLKTTNNKAIDDLHDGVIPKRVHIGPEEFYLQLVLPCIATLELNTSKKHVKHLFSHRETMSKAWTKLQSTPFILHNSQFCKVSKLYDHRVELFSTFMQESVLPTSWRDNVKIMEHLGLHTTVTAEEWLQCARTFSSEAIDGTTESRAGVLLNQLIKMTKDNVASADFLQKVADITFLYSTETHELNVILSHLFPEELSTRQNKIKFKGSVTVQQANIACLCKPILPKSCQPLINQNLTKQALRIEDPILSKTVAENLKCLCERVSSSCTRSNRKQATKLIGIFEKHYTVLNREGLLPYTFSELKGAQCILRTKSPLLQLLKPSQLVVQLPLNCSLEPYCYRASPWLRKYMNFLNALGVRQELKVQDYIDILANIHSEQDDDDTSCNTYKSVIETAYRLLIQHLRQDTTIKRLTGDIYLPDDAMNLRKSTTLCLNDAPWYRSRLPPNCTLKIILPPPVDDEGHRTLPGVLKIKRLSEIIVERMLESCKSPDFRCTNEELFALGRRPESERCVFVRNILDTLKSEELFEGLCRMYYTEYNSRPTTSFKRLANKLKEVQIHCINIEIKTVLCFNREVLPGTEDSNKLCHLTKENNTAVIYIAPHNRNIDGGKFLKDLAGCIKKLLNHKIKNIVPITAAFGCHPSEIHQVLTREKICEYVEGNTTSQAITIGGPVPWKNIPPQDSIVVLNYHPEDTVCYVSDDGSLIYAEVLECAIGKEPALELLEPILTIRVGELSTPQDIAASGSGTAGGDGNSVAENDNMHDSDQDSEEYYSASEGGGSDNDDELVYDGDHHDGKIINYNDPAVLRVSPINVLRMISVSQRRSLWGGATSPFACPVALATVPTDSRASFEQWLEDFYGSQLFTSHSGLIQTVLTLRLLGHLHHQLVVCRKTPALLGQAIQKVSNTFNLITTLQTNGSQQEQSVVNILSNIIRDVPDDVKKLFPTKALGEILDIASDQHATPQAGSSNASYLTFPSLGVLFGNLQRHMANWLPNLSFRRGHRNSRIPQVDVQVSTSQPEVCMRSATAWLLQAKADFGAAQSLFILPTEGASSVITARCDYPALVCFLCHDTAEKSIKGVLYAFCGLGEQLVNCSNLVMLHDALNSSPHRPEALMDSIKECVMIVNRHENRSRFPNYHDPLCAPASVYNLKDAQEALAATEKLLHCLQSEEKFQEVLGDLSHIPSISNPVFQSLQNGSGKPRLLL